MAIKIEKILSTFTPSKIFSKKTEDQSRDKNSQQQQQHKKEDEKPQELDTSIENINKAVADLSNNESISKAGIKIEVVEQFNKNTMVCLKNAEGNVIRMMSAEDFLKLKESSAQEEKPKGKLLDQKY